MRAIESGDLRLEPQTAAHADEMFAVLSDPAIYTYENEPPPSPEWLRDRYRRLETRRSPDGAELWLNWVVRMPTGELIGYVQATVKPDGHAVIAYVLSSAHWGRGLASRAMGTMLAELVARYKVGSVFAILKRENLRSVRLLERLGFSPAAEEARKAWRLEAGELLMRRDPPGQAVAG